MLAAWPAAAADIYLDYTCTLKNAIDAANKDKQESQCEAGSGADTIIFTRDDRPRSGEQPSIREDLVIIGRNHTIDAASNDPVFKVKDAHLTIRDMKIRFGSKRSGPAFEVNDGKLTLINVVVENCKRGVKQRNGHTIIEGASDICGLDADEMVEGSGTRNISIPPPPIPATCRDLPPGVATVSATYGLTSGVQCQLVDGAGIGVQSVVDAGFIAAVNIWAYVEQGVEICFPRLGSLIFLDSAITPRTLSAIDAYRKGHSVCTHLTRPGTVVLMPGEPPAEIRPVVSEPAAGQPAADQPAASQPASVGCPIHTTGHLRLRSVPSLEGEILGYVPRGSNLNAVSRSTFWYQVSYQGLTGWIGRRYVRANC
jgi:hypothetical protein